MKIDRSIGILALLLQKDKVTAGELAEKFEVSRRTILRDIDDICKAGIPLVTYRGKGGGISVMQGFKVDRTVLSEKEMRAILSGLKSLDSVCGNSDYSNLMNKISLKDHETLNTNGSVIIDLAKFDKETISVKIDILKKAAENNELTEFRYYAPNGDSIRTIEPYHVVYQWSDWYVWGFCRARNDYRLFKLSRLTKLKNTGVKFLPRNNTKYEIRRLWHLGGEVKATVRFDASVKWRVIDEYGVEIPHFNPDGSSEISHTWSDKRIFFEFVLGFGDKAEIVSPLELRGEFAEIIKNILKIYII